MVGGAFVQYAQPLTSRSRPSWSRSTLRRPEMEPTSNHDLQAPRGSSSSEGRAHSRTAVGPTGPEALRIGPRESARRLGSRGAPLRHRPRRRGPVPSRYRPGPQASGLAPPRHALRRVRHQRPGSAGPDGAASGHGGPAQDGRSPPPLLRVPQSLLRLLPTRHVHPARPHGSGPGPHGDAPPGRPRRGTPVPLPARHSSHQRRPGPQLRHDRAERRPARLAPVHRGAGGLPAGDGPRGPGQCAHPGRPQRLHRRRRARPRPGAGLARGQDRGDGGARGHRQGPHHPRGPTPGHHLRHRPP